MQISKNYWVIALLLLPALASAQETHQSVVGSWKLNTSKDFPQSTTITVTKNSNNKIIAHSNNADYAVDVEAGHLVLHHTNANGLQHTETLMVTGNKLKGTELLFSFDPEVCSNHSPAHAASSPQQRQLLAKDKGCTGFHQPGRN